MKNRLFITGLALGIENKTCPCSNYNVDWLFENPSILLWAEKIIITESIWNIITTRSHTPSFVGNQKNEAFAKTIKLVFEILHAEGLIEIVNINGLITEDVSDSIYTSIESDIEALAKRFPKSLRQEDDTYFKLKDSMYCVPRLWTTYAGLILSRYFNANALFNSQDLNFYDFKYRIGANRVDELSGKLHAFQNVLELNLPDLPIGHAYLFDSKEQCTQCVNESKCKETYLFDIEKNVKSIIEKRNYDEIQQVITLLNTISRKRDSKENGINPIEFANEFSAEKNKINKRVKSVFPKVKRWSNLTTFVSIPIALSGLITGNPFLAISGSVTAGIAKGSEELIKYFENKYNWINYLNK